MSPTDKIYYAVIILLAAVSVLLSPFFYFSRSRCYGGGYSFIWVRHPGGNYVR